MARARFRTAGTSAEPPPPLRLRPVDGSGAQREDGLQMAAVGQQTTEVGHAVWQGHGVGLLWAVACTYAP